MNIEIVEHGVMLTDYFQGTNGVMLSIPVDKKTTVSEVLQGIQDEISLLWDHIDSVAQYHGMTDDIDPVMDRLLADMKAYVAKQGNADKPYDESLDYTFTDDDDEYPVAIFSIEFSQ